MAKQITTFILHRPGMLAAFCSTLKQNGIDMRAMNVGDAMEFGIVRAIVNDTEKTKAVLEKEHYVCYVEDVLAIEVEDHPGSLVGILETFANAGVNLEYTYALFSRHEGTAGFVIRTSDNGLAAEALDKAGIRVISDEEL